MVLINLLFFFFNFFFKRRMDSFDEIRGRGKF